MSEAPTTAWFAYFDAIPEEWKWPLLVLVLIVFFLLVFLAIKFRGPLGQILLTILQRIEELRIGENAVKFKVGMREANEVVRRNPELTQGGAGGGVARAVGRDADLSGRDIVIESWGSLKQIVFDAAAAHNIPLSPAIRIPDAVDRLLSRAMLTSDHARQIKLLYDLGEQTSDKPGKVSRADARMYREHVAGLVDWITFNVISAKPAPPAPAPRPPAPRRRTQVGGYFPEPAQGRPVVIMSGIAGPLQGRQFAIEKDTFYIGADPDNDVVITGDSYVSGRHACLRYENGSLVLADQRSHNGTFLNGNRLRDVSLAVKVGDRVKIGNSTFEIVPVPSR
ncbi:MAG: FHA domain-containing protein [Gammaproteobacteria bacterium]